MIAAGYSGPGNNTVSSPGCAAPVLTVGAVDRDDTTAVFSSRGPAGARHTLKPEISAPGVGISAAAMGGRGVYAYQSMSGASMATPHVAGAAALVKQRHPEWTAQQVKAALVGSANTAVPGHDPGTLDLAVEKVTGNDGSAVRSRIARLDRRTVTVPAGATVRVPLTLEPAAKLERSQYGDVTGGVVATANGVRVSRPLPGRGEEGHHPRARRPPPWAAVRSAASTPRSKAAPRTAASNRQLLAGGRAAGSELKAVGGSGPAPVHRVHRPRQPRRNRQRATAVVNPPEPAASRCR